MKFIIDVKLSDRQAVDFMLALMKEPAGWSFDGSNSQRAPERGSEVAGGVMREDAANRRDSSNTSIAVSHGKVNERTGEHAY